MAGALEDRIEWVISWTIGPIMLLLVAMLFPVVFSTLPLITSLYFLDVLSVKSLVMTLGNFYRGLWYFCVSHGRYEDCPVLKSKEELPARVHLASLALALTLWDKPHYRHSKLQDDLKLNLRNVAIPGTGIPLSVFTNCWVASLIFILICYPIVSLIAAINTAKSHKMLAKSFREHLLYPRDWFSLWRLNCALAALHFFKTRDSGYKFEDKWEFLKEAERKKIPVTPWLDMRSLVVKHRNEEGGLGFHRFENVLAGGNWIIQEALENRGSIKELLPKDAPLSTFRVLTASTMSLGDAASKADSKSDIKTLTVVWRAGRSGAATDHKSILFDVNSKTGRIRRGATNQHWYKLGPGAILTANWTQSIKYAEHPDTGNQVEGKSIKEIKEIIRLAEHAHKSLVPGVPLVGWDVAITDKGLLLLEGNFSCNFFMGSVEYDWYYDFCDDYFRFLWLKAAPSEIKKG
mmetsp:Transcript_17949/g.26891  ORF Transcript_17949/g.26891 Transcript_17949/m.26891 type:complete len:461 (+) Transcript_17949:50-1432(+)|eukprot:CAMPEP_0167749456 /NCGR_PEP_ID=MMETSP0110_2-20121227/5418_1 /TAXON_ID=629695 /ORGANISM="Gymnochlora sp., Strain CCMP2014" /LENGTH=460 /DNA_ID=CAMNT_0007634613 /DNA_START=20 /DNA_END=1405 /DNA_ORIENTATION=+